MVSQRLLPRLGRGRLAAVEVMVNTARIADLIREPEKTEGILDAIEDGAYHHMQSFSQVLDFETAAAASTNRHDFEIAVEQALRRKQGGRRKGRRGRGSRKDDRGGRGGGGARPAARAVLVLMLRPVLAMLALGLALGFAVPAQAAGLPSHETPNDSSLVVPFSMSTPPARPEQRSYAQLLELWKAAGAAYGVPWEVLGAINKIESNFGRNMGPSSAGALGWMQFMPSTWMRWGTDADGDGVANPWDPEDGIYSAARYLAAAGAREDLYRAVFAYNHADWYVRDVLELAQAFAGGGGFDPTLTGSLGFGGTGAGAATVFQIDDLEKRLSEARRRVSREQRQVVRAEKKVVRLGAAVFRAEQRAGNPNASNAEFKRLEATVTRLVLVHERAVEKLAKEREDVVRAAAEVDELKRQAEEQASTFTFSTSPASSGLGGAAQFSGEHVFPVGGGPAVVSVAGEHHDYPAADIAAPEGAPVFALAAAVVTDAYPSPKGRCGIGFTMRLEDGRSYTYCHLSYMEPHVATGAALSAGTPVGLVGSTGNSTGPHLHLQRNPTDAYPQQEPWFQSFAGIAFRWQGAGAPPAAGVAGDTFAPAGEPVITFTP